MMFSGESKGKIVKKRVKVDRISSHSLTKMNLHGRLLGFSSLFLRKAVKLEQKQRTFSVLKRSVLEPYNML